MSGARSSGSDVREAGEHATLLTDLSAGMKLLAGMLGLTVALLPAAERAFVLNALAALQDESAADGASQASVEAAQALTVLIERFSTEVAAARAADGGASPN